MPRSQIREIFRPDVGQIKEKKFTPAHHRANGESFDFAGRDTQYATHGTHPYVAAINPPLAKRLLTHYVPEGGKVLDPFCGGGGVLVECMLNGRRAVGVDVNPLAVVLSKAKTKKISGKKLTEALAEICNRLQPKSGAADDVPDLIRFWYYDYVLEWLVPLAKRIASIDDEGIRDVFRLVLSATARDVMLTYRGEVRLRKMRPKDQERFKPDVLEAFRRRAELAVDRVSKLPAGNWVDASETDCRTLNGGQKFDAVLTSPPYGDDKNGVGYFQFSRNMLHFLGVPQDSLKEQRKKFLGCGSQLPEGWEPPSSVKAILEGCSRVSERLYKDGLKFYHDYFQALKTLTEVTRERIIIVTGDRVLARTFIDNGKITEEMLTELGWPLEHYYSREIKKKRIANLGGDGGQISMEHILVHRKR